MKYRSYQSPSRSRPYVRRMRRRRRSLPLAPERCGVKDPKKRLCVERTKERTKEDGEEGRGRRTGKTREERRRGVAVLVYITYSRFHLQTVQVVHTRVACTTFAPLYVGSCTHTRNTICGHICTGTGSMTASLLPPPSQIHFTTSIQCRRSPLCPHSPSNCPPQAYKAAYPPPPRLS